jgi:hypothetical protein
MARRRTLLCAAVAAVASTSLIGSAAALDLDHPGLPLTTNVPPGPAVNAGGTGATWQRIWTFGTGNPHTDLDFFTQGAETYVSVGTLAAGPNSGGQSIFKLTRNGAVDSNPLNPSFQLVANHPSAFCASNPQAALGLQHDVEAAPKGNVLTNNPFADRRDAQVLIDATDQRGRCHDSPAAGFSGDPRGGLEIIDITNVAAPKEIGLTSHIGEAHTVNVDPKRPHIAFAVSSDSVGVTCNADDTDCKRPDEDADPNTNQGFALDGFELVDLKSCLDFPPLTSLDAKRLVCANGIKVYRYRWPSALIGMGHTRDNVGGCHELEIHPNDLLTCAGLHATMLFDLSGAFNNNGTPNNYLDDTVNGTPLPCRVRDSLSPDPPGPGSGFFTGAKVVDCVDTDPTQPGNEMTIEGWKARGAPSLAGVTFLGSAFHEGRPPTGTLPTYPPTEDIEVSHEAELTHSGRFMLATDERGGGVLPPQASCATSPADNPFGNGGIHAYRASQLLAASPSGPDAQADDIAYQSYARTPTGAKAIYRAQVRTQPEANVCTSHVFRQIPGQNRIFMGWYSQGTQVLDYVEHASGAFEFREVGWFIPENANTWVSDIFKMRQNANGTFTYWGATGDFNLGTAGRNAVDVYEVTLPAPPQVPTAVTLLTFSAHRVGRSVELRWRTAQETALLGFNVYRFGGGRAVKMNRTLIPARAAGLGTRYRFLDRSARSATTYTYRLQAVRAQGGRAWLATATISDSR